MNLRDRVQIKVLGYIYYHPESSSARKIVPENSNYIPWQLFFIN